MRRTMRLMLAILVAGRLEGQEYRGTVIESTSLRPIGGVVISLQDSAGVVTARVLSDELGRFRLPALAGSAQIRAQRIGFRPSTSPITGDLQLTIRLVALPRLIERSLIVASACRQRADAERTAALLEQAQLGLLGLVVARERDPGSYVRVGFARRVERGRADRIEWVRIDSTESDPTTFRSAISAAHLVSDGFLTRDSADAEVLHAPDADVLLNDEFVRNYCFRIVRSRARPVTEIGLGFRRERPRDGRVDIEGTLWIDSSKRSLREIEFRYRGLDRDIERLEPGGNIRFGEMPNGATLVESWAMRLVGATIDTVVQAPGAQFEAVPTEVRRLHVRIAGAELATARWPGGAHWEGTLGDLRLRVVDSTGQPARGRELRLDLTDYRAITDSTGHANLGLVLPGAYAVSVLDARLTPIGLAVPASREVVAVRDSTVEVTVVAPSTFAFVGSRCARHQRFIEGDTVPYIVGRVPQGTHDARIRIAVEVGPGSWQRANASYDVGSDGYFFLCSDQLRIGMEVRVEAHRTDSIMTFIDVTLAGQLTVVELPAPATEGVVIDDERVSRGAAQHDPIGSEAGNTVIRGLRDVHASPLHLDRSIRAVGRRGKPDLHEVVRSDGFDDEPDRWFGYRHACRRRHHDRVAIPCHTGGLDLDAMAAPGRRWRQDHAYARA